MYNFERFNIARALATCLEKSMEPRFPMPHQLLQQNELLPSHEGQVLF